jgi:hypothetical protein
VSFTGNKFSPDFVLSSPSPAWIRARRRAGLLARCSQTLATELRLYLGLRRLHWKETVAAATAAVLWFLLWWHFLVLLQSGALSGVLS